MKTPSKLRSFHSLRVIGCLLHFCARRTMDTEEVSICFHQKETKWNEKKRIQDEIHSKALNDLNVSDMKLKPKPIETQRWEKKEWDIGSFEFRSEANTSKNAMNTMYL